MVLHKPGAQLSVGLARGVKNTELLALLERLAVGTLELECVETWFSKDKHFIDFE